MEFSISAFTHPGTSYEFNEDHVLVNGQLLNKGEVHLQDQNTCFCFVADGVGGNNAGRFASHFVLKSLMKFTDKNAENIQRNLFSINEKLIAQSETHKETKGAATTLTGLIADGNNFQIIHAGDSQIWLLRNEMFFQVTNDQVLDETEKNSSIISYFGGFESYLKFDKNIFVNEILKNDVFLICSDGLLKSLNQRIIKSILMADKELKIKVKRILKNCLQAGAIDNISVILIQQNEV